MQYKLGISVTKLDKKNNIEEPVKAVTLNEFATKCKREYALINNATLEPDTLNWGVILKGPKDKGTKVIIVDGKAQDYIKRCKLLDRLKKSKK